MQENSKIPLIAGFAAKTMIYRGLGSGIKRVVRENIAIDFANQESANQFKAIVWRNAKRNENTSQKYRIEDSDNKNVAVKESNVAVNVAVNTKFLADKYERNMIEQNLQLHYAGAHYYGRNS